jgi:sugar/nucleoside kinase (ribokinase family)
MRGSGGSFAQAGKTPVGPLFRNLPLQSRVRVPHLLSAGEAFEDLLFVGLERLPAAGEEVRTTKFSTSIGGGAPITAVAAARFGLRVTLASGLSAAAESRLRMEPLEVINLRRPREPHAVSAALSTTDERTFVTFDGVNTVLEPRLDRVIRAVPATHVHLAFYPRSAARWTRRMRALSRRGITTSWDFGWNDVLARDPGLPALMDAVSVLFLNEREAALYGGASEWRATTDFWRQRSCIVVIKLGRKGSRTFGHAGEHAAAVRRVRVVDTTGAGDAFNAGFLVGWIGGRPMTECLRLGNRVGAASTRKAGGIEALPHLKRRRPGRHR